MTQDWSDTISTVQQLTVQFGRTVTLQRLGNLPADVDKPWDGAGSPVMELTDDVQGVFVVPTGKDWARSIATDEQLQRVEQILFVAPGAVNFESRNVVLDDGVRYGVDWVWSLRPGSNILLYAFGVKR